MPPRTSPYSKARITPPKSFAIPQPQLRTKLNTCSCSKLSGSGQFRTVAGFPQASGNQFGGNAFALGKWMALAENPRRPAVVGEPSADDSNQSTRAAYHRGLPVALKDWKRFGRASGEQNWAEPMFPTGAGVAWAAFGCSRKPPRKRPGTRRCGCRAPADRLARLAQVTSNWDGRGEHEVLKESLRVSQRKNGRPDQWLTSFMRKSTPSWGTWSQKIYARRPV